MALGTFRSKLYKLHDVSTDGLYVLSMRTSEMCIYKYAFVCKQKLVQNLLGIWIVIPKQKKMDHRLFVKRQRRLEGPPYLFNFSYVFLFFTESRLNFFTTLKSKRLRLVRAPLKPTWNVWLDIR